ncbi:hypothetical protein RQP46_001280 [Phenoliferia psychrophenolica]
MAQSETLPWVTKKVWQEAALPAYGDLPLKHGLPCAWDVWGAGDQLGTVNLATPAKIAAAAASVQSGTYVSLSLPVQIPGKPSFNRKAPSVKLITRRPDDSIPARDDEIHLNTQSGSQWDGLRHFGVMAAKCFYQGIPSTEIPTGPIALDDDPLKVDPKSLQLGIHNWSQTGISGRGVLLDMVSYYEREGATLHYDPCSTHTIPLVDIKACAAAQKVVFQAGDILILRVGWTRRYLFQSTEEEKTKWGAGTDDRFAGVENSDAMKEWLWENHFAAVASDQPAFEAWPPREGEVHLHQTVIGMYGSPIGEFFDTERLSEVAKRHNRWTFFFTSQPMFLLGGAASLANASAIF